MLDKLLNVQLVLIFSKTIYLIKEVISY